MQLKNNLKKKLSLFLDAGEKEIKPKGSSWEKKTPGFPTMGEIEQRHKKPNPLQPIEGGAKVEDNEGGALQPKVGISGIKHEDAMAKAALSKGYLHKPYVSSYIGGESDGFRKIFAVLGSDGKIVHKTRDKREAHQWLKDNYENI